MTNIGISKPIQEGGSWDETPESVTEEEARWLQIARSLVPYIATRLFFGVLVLLFTGFLTYLGVEMASGETFGDAIQLAAPQTVAYLSRLAQGDLGLTTSGSETLVPRQVREVISGASPAQPGAFGDLPGSGFDYRRVPRSNRCPQPLGKVLRYSDNDDYRCLHTELFCGVFTAVGCYDIYSSSWASAATGRWIWVGRPSHIACPGARGSPGRADHPGDFRLRTRGLRAGLHPDRAK